VASTVGEAKPGNPDPAIIFGQPDDLVAQHDREPGRLYFRVAEVKVGPANRARGDAQQQLASRRVGIGNDGGAQRRA
jgi:hypothetical protein